jgi:hypothetical protein
MKNFATNCARDTMWIFYAGIHWGGSALWKKKSSSESAQSIQLFIAGESAPPCRTPRQIYVPANNRVTAPYIGVRHIPFPSALPTCFLLREIKQLRGVIQRHVPGSRHSLAQKKPIFHSDPQALFRVILKMQYSGIWGKTDFLTCFLIDLVLKLDFVAAQHSVAKKI